MASAMQSPNQPRRQDRLNWLAQIYRVYAADLQHSIYSRVGDLALAEDLTSTVFLKALRWLKEDQSLESARGWLPWVALLDWLCQCNSPIGPRSRVLLNRYDGKNLLL